MKLLPQLLPLSSSDLAVSPVGKRQKVCNWWVNFKLKTSFHPRPLSPRWTGLLRRQTNHSHENVAILKRHDCSKWQYLMEWQKEKGLAEATALSPLSANGFPHRLTEISSQSENDRNLPLLRTNIAATSIHLWDSSKTKYWRQKCIWTYRRAQMRNHFGSKIKWSTDECTQGKLRTVLTY